MARAFHWIENNGIIQAEVSPTATEGENFMKSAKMTKRVFVKGTASAIALISVPRLGFGRRRRLNSV
jgi:hypothetical protein